MAIRPLNSVAGFSVGETPANIILANGDITTTNITTTGVSNLNSVGNVKISGGSAGQVISTDGAGNLSFVTIGTASLNNGTSNITVLNSGNVIVGVGGTANVGTFTSTGLNVDGYLTASGNITGGNANLGNAATANFFIGSGNNLSNIQGANVSGTVANANYAAYAGNITTASQPNITSLGTLTTLNVNSTVNAVAFSSNVATGTAPLTVLSNTVVANLNADLLDGYNTATTNTASTVVVRDANGNVSANYFIGDGSQLTGLPSGTSIANGTSNVSAGTLNGNITVSVAGNANVVVFTGTGANIGGYANITGNVLAGNVYANSGIIGAQTLKGEGGNISNIQGANVSGAVASATAATNASAVLTQTSTNTTVYLTGTESATNGNVALEKVTGIYANMSNNAITATTFVGNLQGTGNSNVGNLGTGIIVASGNITSSANLISDNILGRTGALTITSGGTNTNINLKPNGTGNIDANAAYITNVKDPSSLQDAATKAYVDQMAATGLAYHDPVVAATTTTLDTATGGTVSYNNGASGVGATLVTTGTFNLIDTANVQTVGTRILVKNEANAAWNGVYTYTNTTTITRSTDTDTYGPDSTTDLSLNDYFFVTGGSTNKGSSYVCTTPGTIVFGTTNITFAQFGTSQVYSNGTGLSLIGTTFSITNTTVTAASYGGGDAVATFTVNGQGQLTAAANVAIAANAANLTGTTLASGITTSSLTTVGTLGSLSVTGNISAGNISATNGNLTTANISGNAILGNATVTTKITWASATTSSTSANQTIASLSATGITGVEYLVKAVDSTGSKYSVASVIAVTDGSSVDYSTYGTVQLGGYTGSLAVNVVGGDLRLQVTPASSNSTVWTTQYRLI